MVVSEESGESLLAICTCNRSQFSKLAAAIVRLVGTKLAPTWHQIGTNLAPNWCQIGAKLVPNAL